jgi:shikimate kinase
MTGPARDPPAAVPPGETPERIVLVGFMGAGKTSVGRALAEQLGWEFRDMDAWIEERVGLKVAEIFAQHGEAFFREEERRVAELARTLRQCVIAAGGGAFASPRSREALQEGAVSVWLRCPWETLLARLPADGSRPLAANRATMRGLFDKRQASYGLADRIVDTTSLTVAEAARCVAQNVFETGER